MTKGPIYACIKERKVTLFVVMFLMIFGILNYFIIPKQEAPDVSAPIAIITVVYPGASSENVEKLVTRKIEDELVSIKGYESTESDSRNSFSAVKLRLRHGTNLEEAWIDLRQKMEDLQEELPEECWKIDIKNQLMDTSGIIFSLSSQYASYEELEVYAKDIKNNLIGIDGVEKIDILGEQDETIKVEVDIKRMNYFKLSFEDIVKIINMQNAELPLGKIEDNEEKITIRTSAAYSSTEELENTIITVSDEDGSTVRLKDIASIYSDYDENYKVKHMDNNSILLALYFKEGKNIVSVGKIIESEIDNLISEIPKNIFFDRILYQPDDIKDRVNNFIISLIIGVIFVIAVIFLGMGIRNAIIVSTVIPLSILITFSAMKLFDIKIHQVSITALIIALGMLVDNAIVISDAIQERIDKGQQKMDACVEGVKEVAIPVLTSTLTTVGAFVPLLFINSIVGEYIRSIPQIVIISLLSSYVIGIFVTPTMAYMFFKKSPDNKKSSSRIREIFDSLLQMAMDRKKIALVIAILVFVISISFVKLIGLQFFPKADKNIIYIDVETEKKNDLSETENIAYDISDILKGEKEVVSYTYVTGYSLPKFYDTMAVYTESDHFSQFMIRLNIEEVGRFKTNTQFVDHLQAVFDTKLVGAKATVKELEQGEPIGMPINIRIMSDNAKSLVRVADGIANILRDIPGTVNITDDIIDRAYEYDLKIDVNKASVLGISKYDIQKEVGIALRGKVASILRRNGEEYGILVKGAITSKEELENFYIESSITGEKVPLKEIASINLKAELPNIKKYERRMSAKVSCGVKAQYNPVEIEEKIKARMNSLDLSEVDIVFDGEKKNIDKNFGDVGIKAIFAVMVVYAILLLQFNSYKQPLIILLTVPLATIGSILGLWVSRQPLSFTGILGMVSLMGIVVNNAIVLIDYINIERVKNKAIETACKEAVDRRFRPIMLSTITTVIGLIPLLLSGSELFRPMATALMSGLLVSTVLTLVIIPVVYSLVERDIDHVSS